MHRARVGDRVAKDALYDGFAEVAKALASGRRAEIVDVLAQGERSVDEIAVEIDQSVANTSHHLRAMARAGLVTTRRDGTRIFYRLASDRVAELWSALRDVAAAHVAGLERLAAAYLGDRDGVEVIDRAELAARLKRREVLVLDVRPEAEYAAGHIAGARSVPIAELRRHLRALPEGRRGRRLLPRPVLRVRRRRRARAAPQGLSGPVGSMTGSRNGNEPACRWQSEQEADDDRRSARRRRQRCASRCATSTARSRVDPHAQLPLPHRSAARRPPRLRPDGRRRAAGPGRRVVRRGRQPVLAARASNPANVSSTSAPVPGSTPSSPPPRSAPTGRVVGIDMTAEMLTKSREHRRRRSASTTSSSARASPKRCPSTTAGPTSSSPTASSTSAPTSTPCSPRSAGCCDRAAWLQFADIANGRPVPPEALRDIDLWTG